MKDFFAAFYGLFPFYSNDLRQHLKGWDITGTDYTGTPLYLIIGVIMISLTVGIYVVQYYGIGNISSKCSKKTAVWSFGGCIGFLNFILALWFTNNDLQNHNYSNELHINFMDCIGFAFSNALWSLILFAIITSIPWLRMRSTNCRHTTFWNP